MAILGTHSRRAEALARWALPLATLAFFVATAPGYGIFRDELYYLACGRHLDWGYVDHPPLVAVLAAVASRLLGGSLVGLRLFPALAAAGTVLLVGDSARALGAGRWGRVLAQLLVATAPVYLSLFTIFSMNAFDLVVWAGLGRLAIALLSGAGPRLWIAFGALAGVGLQNKLDVALLGAGIAAGLVVARRWDVLGSRWPWMGGALAVLLFLPHVAWQVAHDWPTREFIARAQSGKIEHLSPLAYLGSQLLMVGPPAALLAAAGLGWLLAARRARPWRPIGWAVVVVVLVLALSVSKPYYLAPAYTLLFPAAGAALGAWTAAWWARRAARALITAAVLATLLAAPLAKPLLPVDRFVAYADALGMAPASGETHELGRLPQFFADMHGWEDLARATARVHRSLPPPDRARACVFAQNYGQAGAIDHFGPALGLPPAISGHNSYWLWGPGSCTGEVLLILGGDAANHRQVFARVEAGGVHRCGECMPYESEVTIWVGRGLRVPLAEAWGRVKHYD